MSDHASPDLVGLFRSGAQALTRHPVLLVPPLAVHVLAFVLLLVVLGGTAGMGALMGGLMGGMMGGQEGAVAGGVAGLLGGMLLFGLLFGLAVGLLSLVASGVVVVMGRDALAGREPVLGDALGAVLGRLGAVVGASVLVTLVVGIGLLLLVLPGLVAMVFLMFALPAVLLDGQRAVEGLRRSVALVRANLGLALGFVVGAILAAVAAWIASAIVSVVPVLGHLAAAVVNGALISYLTVVGVGVYQALPNR
jgi:hypothetical protein